MFIIYNRFTSIKYPYNPEIESTNYRKITGADFLVDDSKKGKTNKLLQMLLVRHFTST